MLGLTGSMPESAPRYRPSSAYAIDGLIGGSKIYTCASTDFGMVRVRPQTPDGLAGRCDRTFYQTSPTQLRCQLYQSSTLDPVRSTSLGIATTLAIDRNITYALHFVYLDIEYFLIYEYGLL